MAYTFSAFAGLNEASLLLKGQRFLAELLHQLLNFQRGFAGPRAGCLDALLGLKRCLSGECVVSLLDFFN